MSIDEKTVRKVARLARIALPEDRAKPMAAELNRIMAWIEQLNEVDHRRRRADDQRSAVLAHRRDRYKQVISLGLSHLRRQAIAGFSR